MGAITDQSADVYRDYVIAGVPSSGDNDPAKAAIRALFSTIDGALSSLVDGVVIGNAVVYSTRAALFADLAHIAGTLGVVYNDATAAYNGVYVKSGGSGSGSWAITNLALPSSFATDLANVISGLAAEVARATAAETAIVGGAPPQTNTLGKLSAAINNDPDFAANISDAIDTKANASRTISTAGLATGGGNLTADRTITVPKASGADVSTGTDDTKAVTPLALAPSLATLQAKADKSVTIGANGLATGGGDLSANRTITVTAATDDQAITGTDTVTAMTPAADRAALLNGLGGTVLTPLPEGSGYRRAWGDEDGNVVLAATDDGYIVIPRQKVWSEQSALAGNLWGVMGSPFVQDGVNTRVGGLHVGIDGRLRATLSRESFLSSEAVVAAAPSAMIEKGAQGQVFQARALGGYRYDYLSTQEGSTLPYRIWGAGRSHVLNPEGVVEVHIDFGQSWRTANMIATVSPFNVDGEPHTSFVFGKAGNALCQAIGAISEVNAITDIAPLKAGVGISIGSVATETLARLRRDAAIQVLPVLNYSQGFPDYTWAQLAPGTDPWTAGLAYIDKVREYAANYGLRPVFRAVGITEGAAGSAVDPVDTVAALTGAMQDFDDLDLNADGTLLEFFFDVTPPISAGTEPYDQSWQQIEVARDNANGRSWMIGPRYQWPYLDNIHYEMIGTAKIGETEALAKHAVLDMGVEWEPLWLTYTGAVPNIAIVGAVITVQVNTPYLASGGLVIDTATIEAAPNYGFTVKIAGISQTINSVAVLANAITITLAADPPAATVLEVSYCAYGPGAASGTHSGVWGNIKKIGPDSPFFTGETIDHWLVPFKEEITA